ncbi:MAG: hypothetical protein R6X32_14015 [Chloroflexota bacterium]
MLTNQRHRMALLLGLTALLLALAACRGNQPATDTETDSELPAAPAQTAAVEEAQTAALVALTASLDRQNGR